MRSRNLCKTYCPDDKNKRVEALNLEQFEGHSGELVAVLGPSGSGKSTLVNCLAALEFPDKNSASQQKDDTSTVLQFKDGGDWYDAWENAVWYRQNFSGIVFQNFQLLPNLDVAHNVEMPIRLLQCEQYSPNSRERFEKVKDVLRMVGMEAYMKHRPTELSGGQRQRIAIARALIKGPRLLLADEPTGNLDERNKNGIVQLLRQLAVGGVAVVMVTHDERYAKKYADRIIRLEDGRIIENQENQIEMEFEPLSMGKMDWKATAGKTRQVMTGESTAKMYTTEEDNVKGNIWSLSYLLDLIKGLWERWFSSSEFPALQEDTKAETALKRKMPAPIDETQVGPSEENSMATLPEEDSKGIDDTKQLGSESSGTISSEADNGETPERVCSTPQRTEETSASTEAPIQEVESQPKSMDKKEETEVESPQVLKSLSDENRSGSQQETSRHYTENSKNAESSPAEAMPQKGSWNSLPDRDEGKSSGNKLNQKI